MPYYIDRMSLDDVPEVMGIEREAFTLPWPTSTYRDELQGNRSAHYFVVRGPALSPMPPHDQPSEVSSPGIASANGSVPRRGLPATLLRLTSKLFGYDVPAPPGEITLAGYAGLWLAVDEAHVTTIATRPQFRGRGFGEWLLVTLAERALDIGARWLTLEVRVSNEVAQNLYRKYGFHPAGLRHRYYNDNHEDAIVMWTEPLESDEWLTNFLRLRAALYKRLVAAGDLPPNAVPPVIEALQRKTRS